MTSTIPFLRRPRACALEPHRRVAAAGPHKETGSHRTGLGPDYVWAGPTVGSCPSSRLSHITRSLCPLSTGLTASERLAAGV
ncbi:Uncharacterised protein [Mycobacteroides abscessus subsp. abscessus]|nr:Uncharacterised protein [Mycobacteroides abscessus subsp. abscessus]